MDVAELGVGGARAPSASVDERVELHPVVPVPVVGAVCVWVRGLGLRAEGWLFGV